MMKNMTAKPARSLAQRARVDDSCVIVLLKLMYLNTFEHSDKYIIILLKYKRMKKLFPLYMPVYKIKTAVRVFSEYTTICMFTFTIFSFS